MKKLSAVLLAITLLIVAVAPVTAATQSQLTIRGYIGCAEEPPDPNPDPSPAPTPQPEPTGTGIGGGVSPYTGEAAIGWLLFIAAGAAGIYLVTHKEKKES